MKEHKEGCPFRVTDWRKDEGIPICPVGDCSHTLLRGEKICPCHQEEKTTTDEEKDEPCEHRVAKKKWCHNCLLIKKGWNGLEIKMFENHHWVRLRGLDSLLSSERQRMVEIIGGEIRKIADKYAKPFEPYDSIYSDLRQLEDRLDDFKEIR